MKAVVISNNEPLSARISAVLEQHRHEVIVYRWLMKAMDNIEEIRPSLVVINTSEYPRHWKILVQFLKGGIGGDDIKVILFEEQRLSEEDYEKAVAMGVSGFVSELDGNGEKEFSMLLSDLFGTKKAATGQKPVVTDTPGAAAASAREQPPSPTIEFEPSETEEAGAQLTCGKLLVTDPVTARFVLCGITTTDGIHFTATVRDASAVPDFERFSGLMTYMTEQDCVTGRGTVLAVNPAQGSFTCSVETAAL